MSKKKGLSKPMYCPRPFLNLVCPLLWVHYKKLESETYVFRFPAFFVGSGDVVELVGLFADVVEEDLGGGGEAAAPDEMDLEAGDGVA